jgi:hypothetical protein
MVLTAEEVELETKESRGIVHSTLYQNNYL